MILYCCVLILYFLAGKTLFATNNPDEPLLVYTSSAPLAVRGKSPEPLLIIPPLTTLQSAGVCDGHERKGSRARRATDQVLDVAVNVLLHARRSGGHPAPQRAELHGVGLVTRAVTALVQLWGGGVGGGGQRGRGKQEIHYAVISIQGWTKKWRLKIQNKYALSTKRERGVSSNPGLWKTWIYSQSCKPKVGKLLKHCVALRFWRPHVF